MPQERDACVARGNHHAGLRHGGIFRHGGRAGNRRRSFNASDRVICDWSLHNIRTEDAKAGDKLILSSFPLTATRGFRKMDATADCATCMKPGTQVVIDGATAIFAQRNLHIVCTHHDCFEFVNGDVRFVTNLPLGMICDVLQLPAVKPVPMTRGDAPCIPIVRDTHIEDMRTMEDITARARP